MNNDLEQQVSEGSSEVVSLDLYDRQVALNLSRAQEDRRNPSNKTIQRIETALHSRPTGIKQYVTISQREGIT